MIHTPKNKSNTTNPMKYDTSESTPKVGVYAGSFDPITIGHVDIIERALKVVDHLHIVIGINPHKTPFVPDTQRLETIQALYAHNPKVTVALNEGLTAKYAKEHQATVLIRGIRNVTDMEYERSMADIHLTHFGLDTLLLFSSPELASISSSVVRELAAFGEDYSKYIP